MVHNETKEIMVKGDLKINLKFMRSQLKYTPVQVQNING